MFVADELRKLSEYNGLTMFEAFKSPLLIVEQESMQVNYANKSAISILFDKN